MEVDKDSNSKIESISGSPKKRIYDESEMSNNKENENSVNEQSETSEQTTSEVVKRARIENDNVMNSDSDFEKETNNSKKESKKEIEEDKNDEEDETKLENDHHYVLKRFYLKRIIRENHGSPIRQIVFNHKPMPGSDFDASNIVATVAKAGISIYDNEHCGNHFDIMAHYILNGQGYLPEPNGKQPVVEGQMNTMCWISKIDDALIATAGVDKVIHILSLSYCKEIAILSGHQDSVVDLISHPKNNNIIISSSSDGTIRIWDVYKEKCICIYKLKYNPTVIAINDEGEKFVVGTEAGYIIECILPTWICNSEAYNDKLNSTELPMTLYNDSKYQIYTNSNKKLHSALIDSIGFINSNNILSKDINGHIYQWDLANNNMVKEFKHRSLSKQNRCRFGISYDKKLFCVGTAIGTVLTFDIDEGKMISEIGHKRSTEPVKCSIFTRNTKSIIYSSDNASIWRFDYVSKKQKKEWENWRHAHPEITRRN